MSRSDAGEVASEVAELASALRELQAELEPRDEDGRLRPPTVRELVRLTSEVTIPGIVLLLRTNIEALKLLQRALRIAEGRDPTGGGGGEVSDLRERAEGVTRATLSRLDDALADVQSALEDRPPEDDARRLLAEARELREAVEAELDEPADEGESVPVDVDAELRSIKDEIDDDES